MKATSEVFLSQPGRQLFSARRHLRRARRAAVRLRLVRRRRRRPRLQQSRPGPHLRAHAHGQEARPPRKAGALCQRGPMRSRGSRAPTWPRSSWPASDCWPTGTDSMPALSSTAGRRRRPELPCAGPVGARSHRRGRSSAVVETLSSSDAAMRALAVRILRRHGAAARRRDSGVGRRPVGRGAPRSAVGHPHARGREGRSGAGRDRGHLRRQRPLPARSDQHRGWDRARQHCWPDSKKTSRCRPQQFPLLQIARSQAGGRNSCWPDWPSRDSTSSRGRACWRPPARFLRWKPAGVCCAWPSSQKPLRPLRRAALDKVVANVEPARRVGGDGPRRTTRRRARAAAGRPSRCGPRRSAAIGRLHLARLASDVLSIATSNDFAPPTARRGHRRGG